ncbi:MAG TPA: hypothetical protein VFV34_26705 [Blastocatellia bacterium]|nr:hypothetical protein [Blastocatellia bacterium]
MADQQTGSASDLMTLYDNYQTPLAAASYRFVLQQTVSVEGQDPRHYYQDQPFEVLAPRYSIESSEIQTYFPPPGGVGDYQINLPHLVLRTRGLPWERKPWPKAGGEPWLALLLLSEQDMSTGQAVAKMASLADLKPDDPAAASWSRAERTGEVRLPKFARDQDPETAVRILDLDLAVFLNICPRPADWPLLAHIRRVDLTDKTPQGVADGEFAVLVANRFPQQGANTIHLISLEGWNDLLGTPPPQPQRGSRVRLISLANWSFVSDPAGQDTFGGLMQRLGKTAAEFGVAPPRSGGDPYVNKALANGYVPLDYQPVESTPTFAWYRGPLSPLVRPSLERPAFRRADAALMFDDGTGIMDVSYAAAWQLGRLLALASPAFTQGLRLFVDRVHNAAEFVRQITTFLELHRSAFDDLASSTAPPREQVRITDELLQWIARLVLLYPVPFHYLVPHPSLLAPESLRFFHLDDNWVDALVDGALSIAVRNLADQGIASRIDLQESLSAIVYEYRTRLQGQVPGSLPSERYSNIRKSGFLLRSTIVSDWPGIEVTTTIEGRPDDTGQNILRFDKISDGVLFCLARGCLDQVFFREPREGITFGVDTQGAIKARKSGQILNVKNDFSRAGARPGVADIAALESRLQRLEGATFGPAAFALQMIRMPEVQVIKWGR